MVRHPILGLTGVFVPPDSGRFITPKFADYFWQFTWHHRKRQILCESSCPIASLVLGPSSDSIDWITFVISCTISFQVLTEYGVSVSF